MNRSMNSSTTSKTNSQINWLARDELGTGGAADGAVAEVPFAMVASVLGVLEWHGFCVRAPKASAR